MTANVLDIRQYLMTLPMLPSVLSDVANALELERKKRNAFYEWVTPDMKVEFINGEIVEHSPATDGHNFSRHQLAKITSTFVDVHDLGDIRDEKAMISLTRNDYEPDIVFWKKSKAAKFTKKQTHYPAPDWVVEILSDSTAKRDRGVKYDDYAAHGVQEYWIVNAEKKVVEQYLLSGEIYDLHKKLGIEDHIESTVIKGFSIPVAAIFDKEANREALLKILSK
jgi:Uma2 family endonuclease